MTFVESLQQEAKFHQTIDADSKFLQQMSIIDYSLLVGKLNTPVEELREMCREDPKLAKGLFVDSDQQAWCIGIIDPLTSFSAMKQAEYLFKQV